MVFFGKVGVGIAPENLERGAFDSYDGIFLILDEEDHFEGETHKFTMRPLIAMGVGLGLDLKEMEEVLRLGGMTFVDGDKEQDAYKYLFTGFYQQDIETCNAFLSEVGVTPLGTKQRL